MIHSTRPTVSSVATIIFCCFVLLDLKSGDGLTDGRTNGWTTCAKIMITTSRDCGSAEWINYYCLLFYRGPVLEREIMATLRSIEQNMAQRKIEDQRLRDVIAKTYENMIYR